MNAHGEVRVGDQDYPELLRLWQLDGQGQYLEPRFTETIFRVIFPDSTTDPVFLIMAALPGATTPELIGPISGVGAAMATFTRTWHGNRMYPRQFTA